MNESAAIRRPDGLTAAFLALFEKGIDGDGFLRREKRGREGAGERR